MHRMLVDVPEMELVHGRAYRKVSPKRTHAIVQLAVALVLQRCAGERGIVGTEWRMRLSPDTQLVPDVAYVSFERLRTLSDAEAEESPFAPDIAVEVRSPSHRALITKEKIDAYLTHGSALILDIDPARQAVHACWPGGSQSYRQHERFQCEAVPWLEFRIEELFVKLKIPR